MSRPTHDAVVTLGEYTSADGTKKKRYQNVGKLFTHDDGRQSLKLDVIPCGPGWTGWISFYPIKRDTPPPGTSQPPASDDPDDDITF